MSASSRNNTKKFLLLLLLLLYHNTCLCLPLVEITRKNIYRFEIFELYVAPNITAQQFTHFQRYNNVVLCQWHPWNHLFRSFPLHGANNQYNCIYIYIYIYIYINSSIEGFSVEIVAREGKCQNWLLKFQGLYNSKNNYINSTTIVF